MSKIDDGGPAFPVAEIRGLDGIGISPALDGMTLRDWFAGQALPWCLIEFGGNAGDMRQYSEAAYQIADAMIAERKKEKS